MRRQSRVKGGRKRLSSGVIGAVKAEVDREARIFGVSKSFVIHTALAHTFGIKVEEYRSKSVVNFKKRRTA